MQPNLKTFTQLVNEGKGASYSLRDGTLNPPEGYMCSLAGREVKIPWQKDNTLAIHDYILKYGAELDTEGVFLGAWVTHIVTADCETGGEVTFSDPVKHLVLDISVCVPTLAAALKLGEANCQQAIYDCKQQKDILI